MKRLFQTELTKVFRSMTFRVCLLGLALVMCGTIVAEYQDVAAFRDNEAYRGEILSWQEREENVIEFSTQALEEDQWMTPLQREQTARRIAIAKYRLDHNIPKDVYKNVWWFFNDNAFGLVSTLVIVLTILLASINIAGEYSGHTLRHMALLPYRRWKLLLAKCLAIGTCALLLYAVVFVLGLLSGFLLHGTDGLTGRVVLYLGDRLTTMNMSLYSLIVVLLKTVELGFYTVFALLLCILTKNVAAAAVLGSFTAAAAVPVCNFLGGYEPWIFFLPFYQVDFRKYLDFGTVLPQIEAGVNSVVVEGSSPLLSLAIVLGTMALSLLVSFLVFQKQDI